MVTGMESTITRVHFNVRKNSPFGIKFADMLTLDGAVLLGMTWIERP